MRHSYATAAENYVKFNIEQEDLPDIVGSEVKILPERLGMHDLQVKKKTLFDPVVYSKNYREGHKDVKLADLIMIKIKIIFLLLKSYGILIKNSQTASKSIYR